MATHTPVMLDETINIFNLKAGQKVIDATFGLGGHSTAMAEKIGRNGKVLGIEQDPEIVSLAKPRKNIVLINAGFENLLSTAKKNGFYPANAVLFDLGMSMWHIKESGRGFSFMGEKEPLSMQFNQQAPHAAELVNSWTEKELSEIFTRYGEESLSKILAKRIVLARKTKKIISVGDLIKAMGIKEKKILARIFQALRIAVNDELEKLDKGLKDGFLALAKKGRMVVISFHSLEDRIVKHFFKKLSISNNALILTKKPTVASYEEIIKNPSARSAKLRAIEKF